MHTTDWKNKLDQYFADTLPEEEFAAFWETLKDPEMEAIWQEAIEEVLKNKELHDLSDTEMRKVVFGRIKSRLGHPEVAVVPQSRIFSLKRWWVAASFIVLGGMGFLWWHTNKKTDGVTSGAMVVREQGAPGKEGAILTLPDGKTVLLDTLNDEAVANLGIAQVRMVEGELVYESNGEPNSEPGMNVLRTPRARRFQVVLPDGSKAWLNAESSITFPSVFQSGKREVDVTGEVYLEVAKDAAAPFFVRIDGNRRIEVLGTKFNVNAYPDETGIRTTLIEGRVAFTGANNQSVLLYPGQQAVSDEHGVEVEKVNVAASIAWVKGVFDFNGVKLHTALRQISRWYDLDIKYESQVNTELVGSAYQTTNLDDMLDIVSYAADVNLTLSGRTVTVSATK